MLLAIHFWREHFNEFRRVVWKCVDANDHQVNDGDGDGDTKIPFEVFDSRLDEIQRAAVRNCLYPGKRSSPFHLIQGIDVWGWEW